jgi:hypothetical protein
VKVYKVRGREFDTHMAAREDAVKRSEIFPVRLRVVGTKDGAWYWRGHYKGRLITYLLHNGKE